MTNASPSGSTPETPEDDGKPFREVDVMMECPFPEHQGQRYLVRLGWVNRAYPMVHIDGLELIAHMRAEHDAT